VTEATSPSSATRSVVDASAVVRAYIGKDEVAQQWLETEVFWPTLIYAEVANALLQLHRHGLSIDRARAALDAMHAHDANARPVESLVRAAWAMALSRSLTVYDACYVVLAEALDVPLVTADRRLAEATRNAVPLA
jgi:predicted nucleic acid-binding protein